MDDRIFCDADNFIRLFIYFPEILRTYLSQGSRDFSFVQRSSKLLLSYFDKIFHLWGDNSGEFSSLQSHLRDALIAKINRIGFSKLLQHLILHFVENFPRDILLSKFFPIPLVVHSDTL